MEKQNAPKTSTESVRRWRAANPGSEALKKLINRIANGSIPRMATLEKFQISIDYLNEIRASRNLPAISATQIKPTYPNSKDTTAYIAAAQLAKDKETAMRQIAEQALELQKQLSAKAAEADKKAVNEAVAGVASGDVAFNYKILTLPMVKSFIQLPKPDKPRTANSVKNYISQINTVVRLAEGDESTDLIKLFKNYKKVIAAIIAYTENVNSRKAYVQAILMIISEYPKLAEKVGTRAVSAYRKMFQSAKELSKAGQSAKTAQNDENMAYPSYEKVKSAVFARFPEWSKQRLIMELYEQVPARDDFGDVLIVKNLADAKDKYQNYLVWKGKVGDTTLILRSYKTVEKYGEQKRKLSPIISEYLIKQGKKAGDLLISANNGRKYGDSGALSWVVSKMLKDSGIAQTHAINFLRHIRATELINTAKTADERLAVAKMLMHSPDTSLQYVRQLEKE